MSLAALRTELASDPQGLGYAPFLAAGQDQAVANLLNALTGPGAATVSLPTLTGDEVRKLVMPAVMVFSRAPSELQAAWNPWLLMLPGVQTATNDAEFTSLCALIVAQWGPVVTAVQGAGGQVPSMDAARVTTFTSRQGSRAEALFGAGVVITAADVGAAR